MNLFLVDENTERTYDQLISDIKAAKYYCKVFKSRSLYEYLLNFVVGLLAEKPLILIDSDISQQESDTLLINKDVNVQIPVLLDIEKILDFNSLINIIKESKSEIIIFTSGTTGQPRKITHTISNLIRSVRQNKNVFEQNKVVWGLAYNPSHIAGLQVFFQAFCNQNPIINLFNITRTFIFEFILKYNISHISATPTFYRLLLPIEMPFHSIIRMTFGGERSDNNLHEKMLQMFPNAKINNIYASTEAGSLLISKGENFQIPSKLSGKIIILNNELHIHKSLMGKSKDLNLTKDFYSTNDLIEWIDIKKGIFKITSRKNELINIGGYKVNPQEVEEAILNFPNIKTVLVYGKPNSVLGNVLCAVIQTNCDSLITEHEVRKYLSGILQDYKIPRKMTFDGNICLTRTGKLKRI